MNIVSTLCPLPTVHCFPSTAFRPPSTVHRPLSTVHCPLLPVHRSQADDLARCERLPHGPLPIAQRACTAVQAANLRRLELAVLPTHADLVSAAGPQTRDRAVAPAAGQGGQEADLAGVALQKRLSHGRREAEGAVALVRAGVVQVRARRPGNPGLQPRVHLVASLQSGPYAELPRRNPAAAEAPPGHSLFDRCRQLRIAAQLDGTAGEKGEVRRDVVPLRPRPPSPRSTPEDCLNG